MKKLIIKIFGKLGYTIQKIRSNQHVTVINKGKALIHKISPDFKILNGPFKGVKYPSIDITELTLVPKITGSYESQLIPLIEEIVKIPYNNILDIGSAEGYYAVGLAKRIPQSIVHAYDINKYDLDFCRQMAKLNGITNITYNNFCSPQTLINFEYGRRSLIFCDCEGYELELFTPEAITALGQTDVLVELHDVLNPVISETLLDRFRETHNVQVVNNSNINNAGLQGLENITQAEKAFAVYEHRGGLYQNIFMEWAYFTPKAL